MWAPCWWWPAITCATFTTTVVGGCDGGAATDDDSVVELGFRVDGAFHPLVDGSELPVINAPQGGFWVMPTLRTKGFARQLLVQAVLDDLVSEQTLIARTEERIFDRGADGWTDVLLFLPLPSIRNLEELAALDGHEANLQLVVSDAAKSQGFDADVVLEAVRP